MRSHRRGPALWTAGVIAIAMAALPAAVRADEPVRDEGLARYQRGEFAAAAAAFAAAFARSRDPQDLFSWAQSERRWGHCDRAVTVFSLYLSTRPPDANRDAAQQATERCHGAIDPVLAEPGAIVRADGQQALQRVLAQGHELSGEPGFLLALGHEAARARPCAAPAVEHYRRARAGRSRVIARLAAEAASACAPPAVTIRPDRPPAWRDWPGALLAASSLAAIATGATLVYTGHRRVDEAREAGTYAGFERAVDAGRQRQLAGAIVGAAGLGVGALAVWRYASVAGRPQVSAGVDSEAVSVLVWFEF